MKFLIFDFDSTIIKLEGLEELAKIVLQDDPKKQEKQKEIEKITNLGMEGKISFPESLQKRLKIINPHLDQIKLLAEKIKKNITESFLKEQEFLRTYKNSIYVISGGFKEFILPTVKKLGLLQKNTFANSFLFDKNGNVIGVDKKNPLSQEKGKFRIVEKLRLKERGKVYVIGDGYTDYEIKKLGAADYFIAFTENISRDKVVKAADFTARNLTELIEIISKT